MRVFSLKKYKQWCKDNNEKVSKWAEYCFGCIVYGIRGHSVLHCIGKNGVVYYVSPVWVTRK